MTDDILDITKWGKEYPFLKHVSDVYDKYNNNHFSETYKNWYSGLCDTIMENVVFGNVNDHKAICMKLMRNLEYFSVYPKDFEISRDHCNILFHWLYNSYIESKITYNVIDKCFDAYYYDIRRKGGTEKKCHYDKKITFFEPTKITLLDIFNDNTPYIINTLKDVDDTNSNRGRKYVCECVKIYKHMNEKYCDNGEGKEVAYKNTCLKLKNFRKSYEFFYKDQGASNFKIPSLDDKGKEFSEKCPPDVQDNLLRLNELETHDNLLGKEIPAHDEDAEGPLSGELPNPLGNADNSMKKSISTTIGTVAGASSLLALLYKFSPGGNWIRSGFRGGRGTINSNLYAGPNEILFDGMEHNGFNSYNIGYEAM